MSYEVTARKWRPQKFAEVVGQEPRARPGQRQLGRRQGQTGFGAFGGNHLDLRQICFHQLLQDEEIVGPVIQGQQH